MTKEEALEEIKEHATWRRIFVTSHARRRMRERFVFEDDIYEAIGTAIGCELEESGNWRVTGQDFDGDELILIISIEGENVIITLF
jgi:hypothetical protein